MAALTAARKVEMSVVTKAVHWEKTMAVLMAESMVATKAGPMAD